MTDGPVQDLTQLRGHLKMLRDALAVNDVAAVEAATASLREALALFSSASILPAESQGLARDMSVLSSDVADTLASRLNAFDLVIEALREEESARR